LTHLMQLTVNLERLLVMWLLLTAITSTSYLRAPIGNNSML
jgi:hypothetical protein